MPTRLSNLNFFILERSLRFRFEAITHAGDFLISRRGGAPTFSFELVANRNDVVRGGKKDNGVPCDVGSNSIRAGHFGAIHFVHRNISRLKVYETILEAVP